MGATCSKSQPRTNCGRDAQNLRANPTLQVEPVWGVLQVLAELRNATPFVILNLFQDNKRPWNVILKQVQDDEAWSEEDGSTAISVMTHLSP